MKTVLNYISPHTFIKINATKAFIIFKLITVIIVFIVSSCGKDFGDINVDPNNPRVVPPEVLMTGAQKVLADGVFAGVNATGITNLALPELLAQSWTQNNYTDVCRYAIGGDLLNVFFEAFYAGVLEDLADIIEIVTNHPGLDSLADRNKKAIAIILRCYTFQLVTDVFGPVPYQEALKGDQNKTPAYVSQREIYLGILEELHQAIMDLDESAGSFGAADIIYAGDVSKWKKFAHSLILRISMRMSDVEPDIAKKEFEQAFTHAFSGNSDNACFKYLSAHPNSNPLHQLWIERGNADLGLSDILIDKTLKPLNDPRLLVWAEERLNGGGYFGRPYGQNSDNAAAISSDNYSLPSGSFAIIERLFNYHPFDVLRPEAFACLMSYSEVCFLMAEAVERGWQISGSAADWYHLGIISSLQEWGLTDVQIMDSYLNQQSVNYITASGDWKQKIGVQKWLALFMQGFQAWSEWRRLDFIKLEAPVDGAIGEIGTLPAPLRLVYPSAEQTLNTRNYFKALELLKGEDKLNTRVWWDVK